jgi:hypothetical protein
LLGDSTKSMNGEIPLCPPPPSPPATHRDQVSTHRDMHPGEQVGTSSLTRPVPVGADVGIDTGRTEPEVADDLAPSGAVLLRVVVDTEQPLYLEDLFDGYVSLRGTRQRPGIWNCRGPVINEVIDCIIAEAACGVPQNAALRARTVVVEMPDPVRTQQTPQGTIRHALRFDVAVDAKLLWDPLESRWTL